MTGQDQRRALTFFVTDSSTLTTSSKILLQTTRSRLYQKQLTATKLPAHLLLQVHDELVLEVDPTSIEEVKKLVITTMENAVSLSVPLLVETGTGKSWMEAK